MSSVYSLEPATSGHVILHTTHGPIDVFLWPREAPRTCRHFLAHALGGLYDDLPFHRVEQIGRAHV